MVRGFGGKRQIMKVIKDFFCIQTKKAYKVGDNYDGKRTDLGHVLEKKKKAPSKK